MSAVDYAGLVELIVCRLVTNPEEASVTQSTAEGGSILLTVKVAQEDIGRVIGKKGSTINALRHIAKAASIKSGEKVDVDVKED